MTNSYLSAAAPFGFPRAWRLARNWLPGADRLASLGLVAVLLVVPGLGLWGAMAGHRAAVSAERAARLSMALDEARLALAQAGSLERRYRLEPGPEIRERHREAASAMTAALERAGALGTAALAAMVADALAAHGPYMAAIGHLFDAVDGGDRVRADRIAATELDPAFQPVAATVLAAASEQRADAARQLEQLAALEAGRLVAIPVVLALAALLVGLFWHVLRGGRGQAGEAASREILVLRQNERRFRALIQNASDMILICRPTGRVAHVGPTAQAGWGWADERLLDRQLVDLVHPDDQPAARDLWAQLQAAPGTTAEIELRISDAGGAWHFADLVLTNLAEEPAVEGVVVNIRDINERKLFEQELARQAFYDSLTGLPNRALLRDRATQALVRAGRRGTLVALMFLDLDNFKLVNDSLGHQVGDELLKKAASRLKTCVRAEDTVARLGGDEFVVILECLSGEADALAVATEIAGHFHQPFHLEGRDIVVTTSVGIALAEAGSEDVDSLMCNADVAMYRAKAEGNGSHVLFDPSMRIDTLNRLELEADLRRALDQGELRVHYQPIVLLDSGRVAEVEALVRWQHPTRGLMPPLDFIPLAEETGLIVPLGGWVLREACRQVALWQEHCPGHPPLRVSVNLSPRQFQQPDLVQQVEQALGESGLAAECLKLEITEGMIMRDAEATIETLWRLKRLGLQLAVDDFGTGYSSLSYLKRLPLDVLKIDRSFVNGIGRDQEDTAIVRAILSLAESLDLAVTAEGIETAEQATLLGAWSCHQGQGFYFGKPLDEAQTTALLASSRESATRAQVA